MQKHDVGLRGERGPILLAIMVSSGLAALDSTILATAVPSVVQDLGGFLQFPWLFSIYLLAQAVTVPLYAKFSDVVGRKPILLFGIGVFLTGSFLCAFAWNMPSLIAFRGLQGLGAGAILPMTITVAGDLYTVEERSKVQGYMASVWGLASVIGPAVGGIFCQYLSWRGIFILNIPLGGVAIWLLVKDFHENVVHRKHKFDLLGAVLLISALTLLILALLEGGVAWRWDSHWSWGCFGLATLLIAAFLIVEQRVEEPILPLWVFTRRLLLTTSLISFGLGATLLGLTSYIPTFLETTLKLTPLESGFTVTTLMIGWPIASSYSGRFYLKIGFQKTALMGIGLLILGSTVLWVTAFAPSLFVILPACLIMGLGFGLIATPSIVAAQASVGWGERGVVTGTNQFSRAIGSSVGVAIFGALANSVLARSANHSAVPLEAAVSRVFLAILVVVLFTLAAAFFMPETAKQPTTVSKDLTPDQADEIR